MHGMQLTDDVRTSVCHEVNRRALFCAGVVKVVSAIILEKELCISFFQSA